MAGDSRPLLAQRLLGDLHDDLLACPQHLGDQLRPAGRSLAILLAREAAATLTPAAAHGPLEASPGTLLDPCGIRSAFLLTGRRSFHGLALAFLFAGFDRRGLIVPLAGFKRLVVRLARCDVLLLAELTFLGFRLRFLLLGFGELLGQSGGFFLAQAVFGSRVSGRGMLLVSRAIEGRLGCD